MPAPVTFNLSLAPLPVNFNGTPQQWATAVVDRLTIAPSAPWSSFQNGGTIPTSNVGPILFDIGNGMQWMVWNDATGMYVDLTVVGDGISNGSIPLSALTAGPVGALFYWDGTGSPNQLLSPAAVGTTVLTNPGSAGIPSWQPIPTPVTSQYFEATLTIAQTFTSSTAPTLPTAQTVNFNNLRYSSFSGSDNFDTANHLVNIGANEVWFFYFQAQFDYAGASTTWQVTANIVSSSGIVVGGLVNSLGTLSRDGVYAAGIIPGTGAATTVKVQLLPTETTGSSTNISMGVNSNNQRFGGFRIF